MEWLESGGLEGINRDRTETATIKQSGQGGFETTAETGSGTGLKSLRPGVSRMFTR
jgi:hypothetical protein